MIQLLIKEALLLPSPTILIKDKAKANAYHEAGHVTLMLAYGFFPESATIIPDGTRGGVVKGINNADMASEHLLVEYGIDASAESCFNYSLELSLAGMIAESFVTGKYNWEGFEIDAGSIFGKTNQPDPLSPKQTDHWKPGSIDPLLFDKNSKELFLSQRA